MNSDSSNWYSGKRPKEFHFDNNNECVVNSVKINKVNDNCNQPIYTNNNYNQNTSPRPIYMNDNCNPQPIFPCNNVQPKCTVNNNNNNNSYCNQCSSLLEKLIIGYIGSETFKEHLKIVNDLIFGD